MLNSTHSEHRVTCAIVSSLHVLFYLIFILLCLLLLDTLLCSVPPSLCPSLPFLESEATFRIAYFFFFLLILNINHKKMEHLF